MTLAGILNRRADELDELLAAAAPLPDTAAPNSYDECAICENSRWWHGDGTDHDFKALPPDAAAPEGEG